MTIRSKPPRIAARAVIIEDAKLLMVNAYRGETSDLWCAPGGGIHPHASLPENLAREIHEETGLTITVGAPCLINEFHAPDRDFHQIEIFFRAKITQGRIDPDWHDPENVVTKRRFFTREALETIRFKPKSLPEVAFSPENTLRYDPLELIVS